MTLYNNYPDLDRIQDQIAFMYNDITSDEESVLTYYTTKYGYTINKQLRDGKTNDITETIDAVFERVPPLKRPIVVWRNINIKLKNYTHLGYTSTTTIAPNADIDTPATLEVDQREPICCKYQITVPSGAKVLPLQMYSNAPHECEILLPRNAIFTCTGEFIENGFIVIYLTYNPLEAFDIINKFYT